jgi:hypothetical protein
MAVAITTNDGVGLSIPHQGHVSGTFGSGSRDDDWVIKGSNPAIRDRWYAIGPGSFHWQSEVDIDIDIGEILKKLFAAVVLVFALDGVIGLLGPSRTPRHTQSGTDIDDPEAE